MVVKASSSAYSNLSSEVNGSFGLDTIGSETGRLHRIRVKNEASSALFRSYSKMLEAVDDEYDGVVIDSERLPENPATFIASLRASLFQWRSKVSHLPSNIPVCKAISSLVCLMYCCMQGKKGVWLKLAKHRSDLVPVALKVGFAVFYMAFGCVEKS